MKGLLGKTKFPKTVFSFGKLSWGLWGRFFSLGYTLWLLISSDPASLGPPKEVQSAVETRARINARDDDSITFSCTPRGGIKTLESLRLSLKQEQR